MTDESRSSAKASADSQLERMMQNLRLDLVDFGPGFGYMIEARSAQAGDTAASSAVVTTLDRFARQFHRHDWYISMAGWQRARLELRATLNPHLIDLIGVYLAPDAQCCFEDLAMDADDVWDRNDCSSPPDLAFPACLFCEGLFCVEHRLRRLADNVGLCRNCSSERRCRTKDCCALVFRFRDACGRCGLGLCASCFDCVSTRASGAGASSASVAAAAVLESKLSSPGGSPLTTAVAAAELNEAGLCAPCASKGGSAAPAKRAGQTLYASITQRHVDAGWSKQREQEHWDTFGDS